MKKQLRGLFCAAALAAVLALPARAAEQTHRAYLCGYPDGSIQPGAPVTRAQLACALVRLAEEPLPEPERVTFFDVPGDHWACAQIGKLTGLGLLPFGDGGWFLPSASQLAGAVRCAGHAGGLGDGPRDISGADWCVGRENGF